MLPQEQEQELCPERQNPCHDCALSRNDDMPVLLIGIDDTDSKYGMCTTYIAVLLVKTLSKYGKVALPILMRLNPTIPYKTRGNGAVALIVSTEKEKEVKELVLQTVAENAELKAEGTEPGVVFVRCHELRSYAERRLARFSAAAVRHVLSVENAEKTLAKLPAECSAFKKKGRGLIGALAATGFFFLGCCGDERLLDKTYELIAYRHEERWGTPRDIDDASVFLADRLTYPLTWDTVDQSLRRVICAPHSPCPILFGIRGDDVAAIRKAYEVIRSEPVKMAQLFVTNQGTDAHLIEAKISDVENYHSYILKGVVSRDPIVTKGGHVFFSLSDFDGTAAIDCAAYEPTKGFRSVVRKLRVGDVIAAYGSVKNYTLNLEKIEVLKLKTHVVKKNPKCDICGRTMESAGMNKGYRCVACKTYAASPMLAVERRDIDEGFYEVTPSARRHLSKPLIRFPSKIKVHPSR
ncbi:MAG: tRNA C34 agmatinyltransferase TiaS [Candidatus Alkanophagales archaeon MCA70_species_2]|nr:tRNA C34 agmatinyltransferase TiaS [Candidatus Alkanophaga liquidiphilum]